MSFRFFIYYCALFGGSGGFVGWSVGRFVVWIWAEVSSRPPSSMISDGLKAMFVGMVVAAALSLIDALWVFSLRQAISIFMRVATALFIATLGGLFGGLVPPVLSDIVRSVLPDKILAAVSTPLTWCTDLFTWAITGALIGVSVGTFDIVSNAVRGKDLGPAWRKIMKGAIGGLIGGFIGGLFSPLFRAVWGMLFHNKPLDRLWLPSASGFIILGMCIGLLIGLAQILLKEAWLRVEQGFRKGREMMLQKDEITIGRAESCDLGLFGDPLVDKLHAKLLVQGKQYFIVDAGSANGTFVNDKRIEGPTLLQDGDTIRLGKSVLRFGERTKQQGA